MKILFSAFLIGLIHHANAQSLILYDNRQVFWAEMDNYFSFFSKDNECSSLSFQTDNGTISNRNCMISFTPTRPGPAIIKVFKNNNNELQLFDSVIVKVYDRPMPEAWVGIKNGGDIDLNTLLAIGGLISNIRTREDHSEAVQTKAYTVIIHKKDNTIHYIRNTGGRFSDTLSEQAFLLTR